MAVSRAIDLAVVKRRRRLVILPPMITRDAAVASGSDACIGLFLSRQNSPVLGRRLSGQGVQLRVVGWT
jgi:hypothetical protein